MIAHRWEQNLKDVGDQGLCAGQSRFCNGRRCPSLFQDWMFTSLKSFFGLVSTIFGAVNAFSLIASMQFA